MLLLFAFAGCASAPAAPSESEPEKEKSADGESSAGIAEYDALYLGVENYGAPEINKDTKETFRYRFEIDGKESVFRMYSGRKDADGNYDYPLQNILKEGYRYSVTVDSGTVIAVEPKDEATSSYAAPLVTGTPGERTVKNFLKTALAPAGRTLYIYGGGWDWQDVGSAPQATSIGVSDDWLKFFYSRNENYTYKSVDGDETKKDPKNSYYPYGGYNEYYYAGLDCSGFVGWALYNTFENRPGQDGFVMSATGMAKSLAEKGFGKRTQDISGGNALRPGDVVSISGHVWISLGSCEDGSVVILHSTPSASRTGQPGGGVQISAVGKDKNCQAYALADKYMSEKYGEWSERYPAIVCDPGRYLVFEGDRAGVFSWNTSSGSKGLVDPDGLQNMSAEEALKVLFG